MGRLSSAIVAALAALSAPPTAAQVDDAGYEESCGGIFGLCGYVRRDTDELLIPRMFERALPFSDGLGPVRMDGLFGFVDPTGKVAIEPRFDFVGSFANGLAEVMIGGKAGVIDRNGAFILEPRFARAIPFTSDVVLASETEIWGTPYDLLDALSDNYPLGVIDGQGWGQKFGLFSLSNGWLTDQKFYIRSFETPPRGLVWASEKDYNDGPFGLLRADGSWKVEPRYTDVDRLREGLAAVSGPSPKGKVAYLGEMRNPYGAVDEQGNLVIPLQYAYLLNWYRGYGTARLDGREALVRPDGTLLGGRFFDEVRRGPPLRVRDGRFWFGIQPDGTLVNDPDDGKLLASCPGGLVIRSRSGLAEFSHPKLGAPTGQLFDKLHDYDERLDCHNPISVSIGDAWGFISQIGVVFPDPPSHETQYGFDDGFAAVQVGSLWGVIDETGAFTVEPAYDHLQPSRGAFRALKAGQEFWIDARGNAIAEPPVPSANEPPPDPARILDCGEGAVLFAKDDLWGMRGPDGEIIPPRFRAVWCFSEGVAWGAAVGGTAWCPIGPDGKMRDRPACQTEFYPYTQTHFYPQKFAETPFENSVLWTRAFFDFARGRRADPPVWVSDGEQGDISTTIMWE